MKKTIIFFGSRKLIINDNCYFQFHNFSMTLDGKGNEIIDQSIFYKKYYENLYKKILSPYLTKKEMKKILSGGEVFVTGEEMRNRILNGGNRDVLLLANEQTE